MNILHTETLKRWGGQQNRVLVESKGLIQRGHRVVIACNRGSVLARKAKDAGIKVYELDMNKKTYFRTIPQLMGIIKREEIDIVSTHSSVDSWAGGIAAKLTGRKLVRFRHNLYPIGRDPLTKFIYGMPDIFIVTSHATRDILKSRVDEKTIAVVPSSVDLGRFTPETDDLRRELQMTRDTMVIGNTSTFTWTKGLESLLQAFNLIHEKIPSVLMIAGRVSETKKDKYLKHIQEDLREKVFLLGHREDIPKVLKTFDIFVFPSVLDSTPQSLLEAMAMERPVVVSDIPTFREFIVDGENGLFFRVRDPMDIARKVLFLIHNRELRERLGRNARRTVIERFTVERMLDKTEALYRELLSSPSRP
jgi:glycosyltransferase involved in cell wall biosynthesis